MILEYKDILRQEKHYAFSIQFHFLHHSFLLTATSAAVDYSFDA